MTKSPVAVLLVSACLLLTTGADAASVNFREGGGAGYVDLTFDDTYIVASPADNTTHGYQGEDGLQMAKFGGVNAKVAILGVKDLFAVLPKTTGGLEMQVQAASLHLFGQDASSGQTVYVNRLVTDWMPDPSGLNENDVSGIYSHVYQFEPWSSGAFSSEDWSATVTRSSSWQEGEGAETIVDVTALLAGIYASGRNYGFVLTCDEGYITARASEHADRPILGVTYSYGPAGPTYALTVNSGSGSGDYPQGLVVDVSADAPDSGLAFDSWTGDVAFLYSTSSSATTITMPGMAVDFTATYRVAGTYALTVNSGTGSGTYPEQSLVSIEAGPAPSGQIFDAWAGDITGLDEVRSAEAIMTIPGADAAVTATYQIVYQLTVDGGSGDGSYDHGSVVPISADPPPTGLYFGMWIGDTSSVSDPSASDTTVTMPASDVTVTATYVTYTLTVIGGTGDGSYAEGMQVAVSSDPAPSGFVFNMWEGSERIFAGWDEMASADTNVAMPAEDTTITATYRPSDTPVDWWPYFNAFCKETFRAELEPLTYEYAGSDLDFLSDPGSEWSYISEASACLAFETNLPARGRVEYGLTDAYGSQAGPTDRHYYLHIYHLAGLDTETTYHYRFVSEDERGNVVSSEDRTFTTAAPAVTEDLIYVPGEMTGPPYVLDQPGKTYLVTEDFTADRTAFEIMADDVTLDLGGHTVVYNQEDYQVTSDFRDTSSMGVRAVYRDNIKIVNGFITQGLGFNTANNEALGYSPVTLWGCSGELAGVYMDYAGAQVTCVRLDSSMSLVPHHNVILDRGGEIDNRHLSPKAILYGGDPHHNLVKRHRQIAFSSGHNVNYYNNEVYVDSCATNGAGIMFYKSTNCQAYNNRIFGTGYLVIGVSTVSSGIADVMVHDNLIHLQATKPDTRWGEYGAQSGAYCCRITWGGDNIQYYDNVMVTYGRDGGGGPSAPGGMVRGTWFNSTPSIVDCVYRDNILKAVLTTLDADIQGAIVHTGDQNPADAPITYSNNRIISNFCNVRLGEDYYASGCNAEFYDNTFVKEGPDRPDYRTIGCGYGTFRSTGHLFYDSVFEPGTGYDQVRFDGSGERNFSVGWTLTIWTEPFADVTVKDVGEQVVFSAQADGNGVAMTRLIEYLHEPEPDGKTYHTPYTVTVEKGGQDLTQQVDLNEKTTVYMYLGGGPTDLAITGWYSAAEHGTTEAMLAIPDDGSFSESRATGVGKLVVTFDKPIDPTSLAPEDVLLDSRGPDGQPLDLSAVSISTSTRNADAEGVISFSPPLPDYARYYVRLSGVSGADSSSLAGDADRILTALAGDVSGSLVVDSADMDAARAARSAPIDIGNAQQVRADVSCDRRANVTDLSRVRARIGNDASAIADPDAAGQQVHQEQSGYVEFQAENYHETVAGTDGHLWQPVTTPEGFLGEGAMQSLPNTGADIDTDYVNLCPHLDYRVNFQTTGTYYVWLRAYALSDADDSCHVGLDGAAAPSAERITGFAYGAWDHWDWSNYSSSAGQATVEIAYTGEHTINVYMREDGLIVDKIVLTNDDQFVPAD